MIAAEEFYKVFKGSNVNISKNQFIGAMREFAKFHVEKALKEATKTLDVNTDGDYIRPPRKESILNAYPLSNIQ